MSVPTFFGQTTSAASNNDAISVAWPAGHAADDIGLLLVQTANQAVATPAGWTEIPDSPKGTGTAGAAGATRLSMYWKRATTSAEANAEVADTGDHQRGRILVFRGCETSGNPFDVTAGDTEPSAVTAVSIPGDTTTVAECLIVAAVANATDVTSNQTSSSGFANPDLTNITRVSTGNGATGVGGGFDVATGQKAVAGAFGATTVSLATASAQARIMVALKPPTAPGSVTEGGVWVGSGGKTAAGIVSATTGTMDTASAQARVFIALKPPVAPPANNAPTLAPIPDKVIQSNNLLSFPFTPADAEDALSALTVTLIAGNTEVPTGATVVLDPEDGSWSFEWTPTGDQAGDWNMKIKVADTGALFVERAFTVTVTPEVSRPPFGAISGAVNSLT